MMLVPALIPTPRGTTLLNVLRSLGLADDLKLCLDVGDVNSYPGTGTSLNDVSGNGHHFTFGAAGAAPTFTGTAGAPGSQYLAFDGGDYLTLTGSMPTWANDYFDPTVTHRTSSVMLARIPSDTNAPILSCLGNNPSEGGWGFEYNNSINRITFLYAKLDESGYQGAAASVAEIDTEVPINVLHQVTRQISTTTDGALRAQQNDAPTAGSSSKSSVGHTKTPDHKMRIGANGDLSSIAPSGFRFYMGAVWADNVEITAAQMEAIYQAITTRGITLASLA